MTFDDLIKAIKAFIGAIAPALAVMLWNYTESKEEELKNETRKAKTELELETNHEAVDKANDGKSDIDILESSISNNQGSGAGQYECCDETGRNPSAGNSMGQKKS